MSKQSIGAFLAILRKASGYTQQEIADKLGVSAKTVSSWETDKTCPDLTLLPILADIFGVTCDELLRGERNRTPLDEEENERAKSKRTEEENPVKTKLLAKALSDFNNKALLLYSFGSGCALFFLFATIRGMWLSKIDDTALIAFQLLSLLFLAGYSLCLYFLLHYYRKAYVFFDTDYISLRYRRGVTYSCCQNYHRIINTFLTMNYIFITYLLVQDILIDKDPETVQKTLLGLIFIITLRIFIFYLTEWGWEKDINASISPEDSVIFRKKRHLVRKRFYIMQGIVSAVCLIPVALYLPGVIRLHLHFAMLAPLILLLQKVPIHLYYAENRGMKHIVLPEEAPVDTPAKPENATT